MWENLNDILIVNCSYKLLCFHVMGILVSHSAGQVFDFSVSYFQCLTQQAIHLTCNFAGNYCQKIERQV